MESGSTFFATEERKKKYHIYVEEYVLSYLRRESDSLELSEIYFYGSRLENGRKLYVYGAGREKGIAAFAAYDPLHELVCRLTQAGPVFLVREPDGECRTIGFQVFYDNNEAMQNYLLEWTGSADRKRIAEKASGQERQSAPVQFPQEEKKRMPHGAMSVQLCLILVVLVAIVITSTDSYDKMEELNRSAREVFFAIENQEAGETASDVGAEGAAEGQERIPSKDKGIVVERETKTPEDTVADEQAEDKIRDENFEAAEDRGQDEVSEGEEENEEGVLKSVEKKADETDVQNSGKETESDQAAEPEDTPKEETASSDTGEEDNKEASEQNEEENEEALSRSITRYYEVEQGDTLYTISQKIYGDISRVEKICEMNEISDPDKIHSGQRIILP